MPLQHQPHDYFIRAKNASIFTISKDLDIGSTPQGLTSDLRSLTSGIDAFYDFYDFYGFYDFYVFYDFNNFKGGAP
jgi:hypothetical protein